ncbi:MAG: patatin-like phospholipase family protein [Thermoleophilia bacterium]|nr:patatin-like phospholipase family protein [Thermoleophilia bacterium]
MAQAPPRDVALVLSGGGINGFLLELGFLKRLRETPLWGRIGWIYGTSAGALSGAMAALDRLDDLERFLVGLQARDVFRPRRVWQLAGGLHDYVLPQTVAERLDPPDEIAQALTEADIELVVFATDVSSYPDLDGSRHFELIYPARTTPPRTLAQALLASAAISALVLPIVVDGVVDTDGSWVRNFPLEHAYRNPDVRAIVGFRYLASYRPTDPSSLARMRERLERFRAVPPVRGLLAELRLAEARAARGEPAHYPELIVRLMRVAVARNTVLEEQLAADRDLAVSELARVREEVLRAALATAPRWRRSRLRAELDTIFDGARFPFRHDRTIPTLVVRGAAGEDALDPTFRSDEPWPEERKAALVARGYRLTDDALAGAPPELRAG